MALETPGEASSPEAGEVELDVPSLIRGWLDSNRMDGVMAGLGLAVILTIIGNLLRPVFRRARAH